MDRNILPPSIVPVNGSPLTTVGGGLCSNASALQKTLPAPVWQEEGNISNWVEHASIEPVGKTKMMERLSSCSQKRGLGEGLEEERDLSPFTAKKPVSQQEKSSASSSVDEASRILQTFFNEMAVQMVLKRYHEQGFYEKKRDRKVSIDSPVVSSRAEKRGRE